MPDPKDDPIVWDHRHYSKCSFYQSKQKEKEQQDEDCKRRIVEQYSDHELRNDSTFFL